jgi:hypothetical protein
MKNETPEATVKVCKFREQYDIGETRMTAILGAMYPTERRVKYVVASKVLRFMSEHPNHTTQDFDRMREEKIAEILQSAV